MTAQSLVKECKYIYDYLMIRLRIPHIVGNKKKGKGFINPF